MKKYRLKKDLPTFKAGQEFAIASCNGGLWLIDGYDEHGDWYGTVIAYAEATLKKFPNILKDWFEEIEEPKIELSGQYVPEEGDSYAPTIDHVKNWTSFETTPAECSNSVSYNRELASIGQSFKTREECQKWINHQKAYQILRQDAKGFVPDWSSRNQKKLYVYYDYETKTLETDQYIPLRQIAGTIYFASNEDAVKSFKVHRKEWLTVLGVEGVDGKV